MVNLSEIYRRASPAGDHDPSAQQLLVQRHWINSISDFDPRTGEGLPSGISSVLRSIDRMESSQEFRDHLWFIFDHCRESIHRIFDLMSESPKRRHEYLHVAKVRELDVSSFVALSSRPGRNVREKLSHKPQMKAVRRFQSTDLPQNQLFKEFVRQLSDLLESRALYLGHEDEMLPSIRRWLRSEEAESIGAWRNLPPNNTLLSHPDYRRIWNSWTWISNLESTLEKGLEELEENQQVIDWWERLASDHRSGKLTIAEIPVCVDVEEFEVTTMIDWSDMKFGPSPGEARLFADPEMLTQPVCIDLTTTFPRFAANEDESIQRLSQPLIWQCWSSGAKTIDLSLSEADAAYLHELSKTYSIVDLVFQRRPDEATISRAARSFVESLKVRFRDPTLLWLVPDSVDEFRLGILRRSLNARFPKAQPLPRSVAAVFRHIPYDEISRTGFTVFVLDRTAGSTFVTKLTAEHDPELEEQVPETRGFYWVRTPHVELQNQGRGYVQISEFDFVDGDENWVSFLEVPEGPTVDQEIRQTMRDLGLVKDLEDGDYVTLEVINTPVKGGLRYLRLQALAGDIPLWRDQIPKLAISVPSDGGRLNSLVLVPEDHRVRLVRGKPVTIPVNTDFELPEGQRNYRFPILQGSSGNALDFEAFLESDDFPLHQKTRVSLELTYTYGADDPYRLVFKPVDSAGDGRLVMKSVVARWTPKQPKDLDSLPTPELPEKKGWSELRSWLDTRPESEGQTNDLLEWTCDHIGRMWGVNHTISRIAFDTKALRKVFDRRVQGKIVNWPVGKDFFFVESDASSDNAHCHIAEAIATKSEFDQNRDARWHVWLCVDLIKGRPRGSFVSPSNDSFHQFQSRVQSRFPAQFMASDRNIQDALYKIRFPTYNIWNLGRSVKESDCPDHFREMIKRASMASLILFNDQSTSREVRNEALLFLSRLHEDAPAEIQRHLADLSARENQLFSEDEARAIAYFIGSCSTKSQGVVLLKILAGDSPQKAFILSKAFTRSPLPVTFVNLDHLRRLVPVLYQRNAMLLADFNKPRSRQALVENFELLLGLLRTRVSRNREIKGFLSPDSEYGSKLVAQIDQAIDLYVETGHELKTRVTLEVSKPPFAKDQPDLLYALRQYLTGDDLARMIRISGISEGQS